ncbi:hypothetical protein H0I76_00100 [Limibaculum sp. M0105]|uniref:Histidine phosphotransferase ChpT C-terminal domain-containing protein n=1 Tax=Thermohalobaculum xanthum TaxID=2753746 RepID=A0A8J7SBF6_9RHOB|nr:histidine phosphotransferase family protein [Thermohalobaculum xanthum]MBK0397576.1 hypothetical protein [Thermohalobaculum xanthum]
MTQDDLAGLVAVRICHDLVNPVGAIGNAADLMHELAGADTREELELVRQSATRASAMLRLLRLAFGAPADGTGGMSRSELHDVVMEGLGSRHVEMRWSGLEGPAVGLPAARCMALMALCGRSLLGMRGRITVTMAFDGAWPTGLAAEGESATLDADARAWLSGEPTHRLPEPRRVELALLPGALAAAGARLVSRSAPGSVLLTALPA